MRLLVLIAALAGPGAAQTSPVLTAEEVARCVALDRAARRMLAEIDGAERRLTRDMRDLMEAELSLNTLRATAEVDPKTRVRFLRIQAQRDVIDRSRQKTERGIAEVETKRFENRRTFEEDCAGRPYNPEDRSAAEAAADAADQDPVAER